MQKANQSALLQATNQGLVQIRNVEIAYYTSYYCSFGCQAAIIGGFAYSALTQIDVPIELVPPVASYNPVGFHIIGATFWISSAVCMCAAMHVIMVTIFISVLGPGLALHGPQGSMAKAANGMRAEGDQVFIAFNTLVISFGVSVLASCWVLMSQGAAIASTIVLMVSSMFWWRSCRRIVNRFHYVNDNVDLDFDPTATPQYNADDSMAISETQNRESMSKRLARSPGDGPSSAEPSRGIFGRWKKPQSSASAGPASSSSKTASAGGLSESSAPTENGMVNDIVVTEGYLSLNEEVAVTGKDVWQRRYLVIGKSGVLYYYANRQAFKEAPGRPLRLRPIVLKYFSVSKNTSSAGVFELQLVPVAGNEESGRRWIFRCDSLDEMDIWYSTLQRAAALQA